MTSQIRTLAHTGHRPILATIFKRFQAALAARRQRRALEALDDASLKDIGVTREEARAEARRPAWDVPAHWLR